MGFKNICVKNDRHLYVGDFIKQIVLLEDHIERENHFVLTTHGSRKKSPRVVANKLSFRSVCVSFVACGPIDFTKTDWRL